MEPAAAAMESSSAAAMEPATAAAMETSAAAPTVAPASSPFTSVGEIWRAQRDNAQQSNCSGSQSSSYRGAGSMFD